MRSALVRSTRFNVAAQVAGLIGNLLVTPIFVRSLGPTDYGLWAIVLAVSGTASAFDLGMTVALTRATPEHAATGRYDAIASLTVVAAAFYTVLTGIGIAIAVIVISLALPEPRESTTWLAIGATGVFAASNLAAIPRALLQGFDRFDVTSTLTIVGYALFWIIGTALVSSGRGVPSLALAMILMFCAQGILGATFLLRSQPRLWHAFRQFRGVARSSWEYAFRFGAQMQVSYVADIVKNNGPRLLAASLFGPIAAGMYDIGARIANAAWALPASTLPAIVPAAAAANVRNDQAELRALYLRGTRWLILVALPLGVLFAAFASLIVQTWIGPGYEGAVAVLSCLALGNVFHLSTGAGTFVARGISRPDVEVRYQIFTLLLYAAFGAALPAAFGFVGIPLAVAIASTIGGVAFAYLFTKWLGVELRPLLRALVGPIIATSCAFVAILIAAPLVDAVAGPLRLALLGAWFVATYVLVVLALAKALPATPEAKEQPRADGF